MSFDTEPSTEHIPSGSGNSGGMITLQKAVEMGEYDPQKLSTYTEWHALSQHVQFQLIRQALDNRFKILLQQWAAIANVPDFSKKPHLNEALRNIERQQDKLQNDKERLYIEYSTV